MSDEKDAEIARLRETLAEAERLIPELILKSPYKRECMYCDRSPQHRDWCPEGQARAYFARRKGKD